jgi:hypothetical protein
LSRAFRLLRVDDEAELTNDRLREGQIAGHVFLCLGNEKEIVEVSDVGNSRLGQGKLDDRQQLRADPRSGAQAKWHTSELVEPALEFEAKVFAH